MGHLKLKQLNTLIEESKNKGYDVYRQPHNEAAWFYNTQRNPYQLHSRADYDIILSQDYKQFLGKLLINEKLTEQTHHEALEYYPFAMGLSIK